MISSFSQFQIALQFALCLIVATLGDDSTLALGQELPTQIEGDLPLTIDDREAGKLNLFMASTADYILDVTFLCTRSNANLQAYDPFGEDAVYPAWRTAVFQHGQFVGYLPQPTDRREFQRLPRKLQVTFVVGAACEIKTGTQTLVEMTASGPMIQVLGYGTYELQTTLLQNFLDEKPSKKSKVIARSAALTLEITESPRMSAVPVNPEGRAELHIADYLPRKKVKDELFYYYVNTTGKTRELYNPFVQSDYGPESVIASFQIQGRTRDYFRPNRGHDFGVRPQMWIEVLTQGIVGSVPIVEGLFSGSEVRIVLGERFFYTKNFFKTKEFEDDLSPRKYHEYSARIYNVSIKKELESPVVVVP